jgi:hypothetical protein
MVSAGRCVVTIDRHARYSLLADLGWCRSSTPQWRFRVPPWLQAWALARVQREFTAVQTTHRSVQPPRAAPPSVERVSILATVEGPGCKHSALNATPTRHTVDAQHNPTSLGCMCAVAVSGRGSRLLSQHQRSTQHGLRDGGCSWDLARQHASNAHARTAPRLGCCELTSGGWVRVQALGCAHREGPHEGAHTVRMRSFRLFLAVMALSGTAAEPHRKPTHPRATIGLTH